MDGVNLTAAEIDIILPGVEQVIIQAERDLIFFSRKGVIPDDADRERVTTEIRATANTARVAKRKLETRLRVLSQETS
jgi:hypothetical protein